MSCNKQSIQFSSVYYTINLMIPSFASLTITYKAPLIINTAQNTTLLWRGGLA